MKEALAVFLVNSIVVGAAAIAADTATVAATVTAQKVSITVSDGSVNYGTVPLGTSKDTTNTGVNDTQVAVNAGNVSEDLNIRGQNSSSWSLGAAAAENVYVHDYCVAGTGSDDLCDAEAVWSHLESGSYGTLGTGIAAGSNKEFDLKIIMPSSTTDYSSQSVDVVVQATAS